MDETFKMCQVQIPEVGSRKSNTNLFNLDFKKKVYLSQHYYSITYYLNHTSDSLMLNLSQITVILIPLCENISLGLKYLFLTSYLSKSLLHV